MRFAWFIWTFAKNFFLVFLWILNSFGLFLHIQSLCCLWNFSIFIVSRYCFLITSIRNLLLFSRKFIEGLCEFLFCFILFYGPFVFVFFFCFSMVKQWKPTLCFLDYFKVDSLFSKNFYKRARLFNNLTEFGSRFSDLDAEFSRNFPGNNVDEILMFLHCPVCREIAIKSKSTFYLKISVFENFYWQKSLNIVYTVVFMVIEKTKYHEISLDHNENGKIHKR